MTGFWRQTGLVGILAPPLSVHSSSGHTTQLTLATLYACLFNIAQLFVACLTQTKTWAGSGAIMMSNSDNPYVHTGWDKAALSTRTLLYNSINSRYGY